MSDFDRVLVLETAGKVGRAALAAGGNVIAESSLGQERRRASDLAQVVEAVAEALRIAREAPIRLQISHLKAGFAVNWPKLDVILDMLEKALTEVCRPLFTEDLSHNELRAFAGHIEIVSELEARGVTRLIDLLATESQLSGELQDARRELAIIDSL